MQMIEHEQTGHGGAFFIEEEGKRLAALTFARSVFDKTPEFGDVLAR